MEGLFCVDDTSLDGRQPLHFAKDPEMVRWLIAQDALVNWRVS
jgi:hypothetical protein